MRAEIQEREADQRKAYLLKARKGLGIEHPRDDLPKGLFRVADWEGFADLVEDALEEVANDCFDVPEQSAEYLALVASLGIHWPEALPLGGSRKRVPDVALLKDRRKLLAEMQDVTIRTVMRHEEKAFDLLAAALEKILEERDPIAIADDMDEEYRRLAQVAHGQVSSKALKALGDALQAVRMELWNESEEADH